jgi:homoserine kinase
MTHPEALVRLGVQVTARTPASSANLGPGFDSLALALDLHDEVSVTASPREPGAASVRIEVAGQGEGAVPLTEDHLVIRSLRAGLTHAGAGRPEQQPALHLRCRNAVPHGRGLGSSAAAIVVGLVLAQGLLTEPERLDEQTVFDLAAAAEGHPDNASAALFGGCTLSWVAAEPIAGVLPRAHRVQLDIDPRISAVLCLPDVELATSRARAMLPEHVPHAHAAFNAARTALLVHALAGRPDLLPEATRDRLHQSQRAPAMPQTAALVAAVRARGVAAMVSGAGPSVLVLGEQAAAQDAVRSVLAEEPGQVGDWQVLPLGVDRAGTHLVPANRTEGAKASMGDHQPIQ